MPSDPKCLFCRIIKGEIKSDFLAKDAKVAAIRDIHPQAPVHLLVMPIEHVATVREATADLMGRMLVAANDLAAKEGLAGRGYRLAINCGEEGGQSIGHLHLHVLGGRQLSGQLG